MSKTPGHLNVSLAQEKVMLRIGTRPEPPVWWNLQVNERTALSLIKKGLAQKVGERRNIFTCALLIELLPTDAGKLYLKALASEKTQEYLDTIT